MEFNDYAVTTAEKYREGSELLLLKNRMKAFRKAFRPVHGRITSAGRILDYGCGSGDLIDFLSKNSNAELVGYDPSKSQVDLAKKRLSSLKKASFANAEGEISGKFDLIFSLHVIEHVPDDQLDSYFRSLISRLSPEGKLVIATPNGMNPFAYAYFMSTDKTHVRMHSVFTISELLQPFGFEIQGMHRETPQAYDFKSTAKTIVWWIISLLLKPVIYSTALGIRGLRFPLMVAPSFFCVIGRKGTATS